MIISVALCINGSRNGFGMTMRWLSNSRTLQWCALQSAALRTVISGLLSAPEYKPHPLNFLKIIIFNINKPHVSISRRCLPVHCEQINFTQAKMNIKSNTIVMHIISFGSYDKCTVALREHSCKSQSEARTLD